MEAIDKKITAVYIELQDYAQSLIFEQLCEFSMNNLETILWGKIKFSRVVFDRD